VTTIVLARHGETDWNRDNRFQGHADPPLNERGREQAAALAELLAGDGIRAVYSSPLLRALETAEIVGGRLGLPVTPVEALREIDVGEWQGLAREEVARRYPEAFARWLAFSTGWEQGESYEELGERVLAGLRGIAAAHPRERVLVVSHGGPCRTILAAAAGVSHAELRRRMRAMANCGVARLAVRDGVVRGVD
jgi:broad specificity phosphatase PhoE